MIEAHARQPTRILAWCLMRNHWHFVVWPREEGEVTVFFRWLAHTHAMRWHVAHNTVDRKGSGGDSDVHGAEPALRRRAVAARSSPTARSLAQASQRRPTEGVKERPGPHKLAASPFRRLAASPFRRSFRRSGDITVPASASPGPSFRRSILRTDPSLHGGGQTQASIHRWTTPIWYTGRLLRVSADCRPI